MSIVDWYKRRQARLKREAYIRGYDYAVGCLLRKELTFYELEHESFDTFCDGDQEQRAWQKGVQDGMERVKELERGCER